MEDIKLDTGYKKVQYWISWVVFVFAGMIWAWVAVLLLANYGKTTSNDVKSKNGVLNKSWQKFVYIYGQVGTIIIIFGWILIIFGWILVILGVI